MVNSLTGATFAQTYVICYCVIVLLRCIIVAYFSLFYTSSVLLAHTLLYYTLFQNGIQEEKRINLSQTFNQKRKLYHKPIACNLYGKLALDIPRKCDGTL